MMTSCWVNFARTDDPNGAGLPNWGRARQPVPETPVIDGATASVPDFLKAQFLLWFDMWEKQTGLEVE